MSLSPTARVPSMVKKCQRFRQRFNQLEVNIREQPRTRRLDIEQELNTNGLARTSHGEMACKGSGVRIPLPPLTEIPDHSVPTCRLQVRYFPKFHVFARNARVQ